MFLLILYLNGDFVTKFSIGTHIKVIFASGGSIVPKIKFKHKK